MKIALCGGMANNCYNITRVLRKQGIDADYVHEYVDTYPMSQPLWEDIGLIMKTKDLNRSYSVQHWKKLAKAANWQRPAWTRMVDPPRYRRLRSLFIQPVWNVPDEFRWRGKSLSALYHPLIEQLQQYEYIIACGFVVEAALASGRPYTFYPFGGDINLAPFWGQNPDSYRRFRAYLMQQSIRSARKVISHLAQFKESLDRIRQDGFVFFNFIIDTERYAPAEKRTPNFLPADVVDKAREKTVIFMPSRQDFYWKGSDKFLKCFSRCVRNGANLFLITAGWGNDVESSKKIVEAQGVQQNIYWMPFALSKPYLIQMYNYSDVVADQFSLGIYGTSFLEAMACSKVVLSYVNTRQQSATLKDWSPPPVLNVFTETEIEQALMGVADAKIDLNQHGRQAREWIIEHHTERSVRTLLDIISAG
jgi:glycosyltransferase involved in cell wall biosynthesis